MNLDKILGEIEKHDPEVYDRLDTRRHAMQRFVRASGKIALTAVPFAFGAMLNKAYSQSPANSVVLDVLTYALTLEHLESKFYSTAVSAFGAIGVPAGPAQGAITNIANDEAKHVIFLKGVISQLSPGTSTAAPNIDLTGGGGTGTGPFAAALTNYDVFLAVAQTFEDTGVRAYKGRAKELAREKTGILTAALNIHSVEARHAAHIRSMRAGRGASVKPWITLNQSGIGAPYAAAVQPSYDGAVGEDNTMQAGINITGIGGVASISSAFASEAFDEPLTKAEVLAIVAPFFY